MRRRLRQQTRMREALLVDLGALVYELHRHGRREPELLQAKASELTVVDQEVRALADALGAGEGMLALVSAGIAGSCEHCGTLLSTDARYCSGCGAEAAPSLPGSSPAAPAAGPGAAGTGIGGATAGEPGDAVDDDPLEPSERDSDPEATGVLGRWPQPARSEPVAAEQEPREDEPPQEDEPEAADDAARAPATSVYAPPARAPWLTDEEEPAPLEDTGGAATPPPGEPTAEDPAPAPDDQASPLPGEPGPGTAPARRRSGGAVGKVAGMLRRGRDGG